MQRTIPEHHHCCESKHDLFAESTYDWSCYQSEMDADDLLESLETHEHSHGGCCGSGPQSNFFGHDPQHNPFFSCLNSENLEQICIRKVQDLVNDTGLPDHIARTLLMNANWDNHKAQSLLFDQPLGQQLIENNTCQNDKNDSDTYCEVCYEENISEWVQTEGCGHRLCKDCYKDYLENEIMQGSSQVCTTQCPHEGCKIAVTPKIWKQLLKPGLFEKYQRYIKLGYVDNCANRKWCPQANCKMFIERKPESQTNGQVIKDVYCTECEKDFCFDCDFQTSHCPVSCEIVDSWQSKCLGDAQGEDDLKQWLKENTKNCPNCKQGIQKNDGCHIMTCCKCKIEFCWYCLQKTFRHDHIGKYKGTQCPEMTKYYDTGIDVTQEKKSGKITGNVSTTAEVFSQRFNVQFEAQTRAIRRIPILQKEIDVVNGEHKTQDSFVFKFLLDAAEICVQARKTVGLLYAVRAEQINSLDDDWFLNLMQRDLERKIDTLQGLTNQNWIDYWYNKTPEKSSEGEAQGSPRQYESFDEFKLEVNTARECLKFQLNSVIVSLKENFPEIKQINGDVKEEKQWECKECKVIMYSKWCRLCGKKKPKTAVTTTNKNTNAKGNQQQRNVGNARPAVNRRAPAAANNGRR